MESLYVVLVPVIVALISGIFAVIKFVVAKDQKTSEFRQNWIDLLRNDVAEYISISSVLFSRLIYEAKNNKISPDEISLFFKDNNAEFVKRDAACNRIFLRVNPVDDHEIIKAIQDIEKYWEGGTEFKLETFSNSSNLLIKLMQKLLKKEWVRVKNGEVFYRIVKYAFVLSIFILVIITILLLSGTFNLSTFPNSN